MNKKKVIIVGAGIGGIATAIKLARNGFDVSIYEKNKDPGGRCQRIIKSGHTFDTGPTMYLFPQIFEEFFASIGEDVNKHLRLIRVNPTYRINFADKTNLVLTSDKRVMRRQLENIEPGSYENFIAYLENAEKHYDIAINHIASKRLVNPFEYFSLTTLLLLLKSAGLFQHMEYTKRFFKDPHLQSAFTFQDSYISLNPFQAPSIYSLFAYSEFAHGSFLPEGGMYQVIHALVNIAKKHNVKISFNSPVRKVLIKGNKAYGIKFENTTVQKADLVVLNSDLSYSYEKLLPQDPYVKALKKKKYSCSALVFHWGVDKQIRGLKTHNIFFSQEYEAGFKQVINNPDPPPNPHFYIQAPSRTDKTRAPQRQDTLSVMVPINRIHANYPIDWERYKSEVKDYVLERLEETGIKDMKKHIKFEITYTPKDWRDYLNLPYGSVYGLHHNITQLGYLRPKRVHPKYKNVFFVGSSTHPGSGLPTVLQSATFTSEKILSIYS